MVGISGFIQALSFLQAKFKYLSAVRHRLNTMWAWRRVKKAFRGQREFHVRKQSSRANQEVPKECQWEFWILKEGSKPKLIFRQQDSVEQTGLLTPPCPFFKSKWALENIM